MHAEIWLQSHPLTHDSVILIVTILVGGFANDIRAFYTKLPGLIGSWRRRQKLVEIRDLLRYEKNYSVLFREVLMNFALIALLYSAEGLFSIRFQRRAAIVRGNYNEAAFALFIAGFAGERLLLICAALGGLTLASLLKYSNIKPKIQRLRAALEPTTQPEIDFIEDKDHPLAQFP